MNMKRINSINHSLWATTSNRMSVFAICLLFLCFFKAGLVSAKSEVPSAELRLVNDQVTPVPSTVVSLSADTVYQKLGVPLGSPVNVTTESGNRLSTSFNAKEKSLEIWTSMGPSQSLGASIVAGSKWQEDSNLVFAHQDSEAMIINRCLRR